MIFFVQHFLAWPASAAHPDYPLIFETWNKISSIALRFGLSQLLFLYVVLKAIRSGEKAPSIPGKAPIRWNDAPADAGALPHVRNAAVLK